MKEIIERKIKDLEESYNFWLELQDIKEERRQNHLDEIRSKIMILKEILNESKDVCK